jgi:hypothetical protein
LCPVADTQFAVQSLDMGVDGVGRNIKIGGDGKFRAVVEDAANDL